MLWERPENQGWAGLDCCVVAAGWLTSSNVGPSSPTHPRSPQLSPAKRACLFERTCYLGGMMPSQYNSATLPYTSRSREHVYSVSAVKLLAPAIWRRSLMSIPPVFQEDGLGEVGQQRSMLKRGWGETQAIGLASTFGLTASCSVHDNTVSESKTANVSNSVQRSA